MTDSTKAPDPLFEEFDMEVYGRTSPNNMPFFASFVELTDDEQAEVDEALALSE
ncbi:hypothetical protein JQS43_12495 [Natronosporangium hydrolyticum]|uniref:Uncharacterized protein n=1 Tax=Natronosporangium hydrolyticum TaxID=2811111 RepID=A0A895YSL4_9ACTN|nr:hypothetical protein [Natronosporangium hydrolyticum]QSB17008.1 hypothetical protein JQS43_12495 [Natronosporangium hydrolyticum]